MEERILTLIEILNMLARGEEMPEYIEWDSCNYVWEPNVNDYRAIGSEEYLFTNLFQDSDYNLNDRVYLNREFDYSDIEKNIKDLQIIFANCEDKDFCNQIATSVNILKQYLQDIEKWEG